MSSDLLTVSHGDTISSIRKIFEETGVHHIPVVSGGDLIGIVTWNKFMQVTLGDLADQHISNLDTMLDQTYELDDVMRRTPVSIDVNSTIHAAAEILGAGEFHSLPVTDGKKLVGIVTSSDLIRYLAELV